MGHYAGEMGYGNVPDAYERAGFLDLTTPGLMACRTCRTVFYSIDIEFAQEHKQKCQTGLRT